MLFVRIALNAGGSGRIIVVRIVFRNTEYLSKYGVSGVGISPDPRHRKPGKSQAMHKNVTILRTMALPQQADRQLEAMFTVIDLPADRGEALRLLRERGSEVRGVASRRASLGADDLALLPNLELIANFGAGVDGIDVAAAAGRGIVVRTGAAAVADDVADFAVGMTIALLRGIVRGDQFVRSGHWGAGELPLGKSLRELKAGVVGLGNIGAAIARRLETMGCEVAYFGRSRKSVHYRYFPQIGELAAWAQLLVVACPATPDTRRLIDARVLAALGNQGYLVNVSRGVVVDEQALIDALATDSLAGAALDVFEREPDVPAALRADPRVVLTPHIGGGTAETHQKLGANVVRTLSEHFDRAGKR
jgi:lactate dehydrogenase-like 2-hydroxyacid dehydrogenase